MALILIIAVVAFLTMHTSSPGTHKPVATHKTPSAVQTETYPGNVTNVSSGASTQSSENSEPASEQSSAAAKVIKLPLPVDHTALIDNARLAINFVATQNSYGYEMDVTDWMNTLTANAAPEFAKSLQTAVPTAEQIDEWRQEHLTAVSTATVTSIYLLAQNTVTYIVTAHQKTTTKTGTKDTGSQAFNVTFSRDTDTGNWQLSNVNPAGQGDN